MTAGGLRQSLSATIRGSTDVVVPGITNALIGGAAGGAGAWLRGKEVRRTIVTGRGGLATLPARASLPSRSTGLRRVVALGTGVVRNASLGHSLLHDVWLTLGPVRARVDTPVEAEGP
jgi:hypothetical protein